MGKRLNAASILVVFLLVLFGCRMDPIPENGSSTDSGNNYPGELSGVKFFAVSSRNITGGGGSPVGDVVLFWNDILNKVIRRHALLSAQDVTGRSSYGPTWTSRNLAMVNGAMFDAFVSVKDTYKPYLVDYRAPDYTSVETAALTAAYHVSRTLYPDQKNLIDPAYKDALPRKINPKAKLEGLKIGKIIASAYIEARRADGSKKLLRVIPGTEIGEWRPTYPDYSSGWWPLWGNVTPFVMGSTGPFEMPGPPPVSSREYAMDYEQVRAYGAVESAVRTADQTETAVFWSYDSADFDSCVRFLNQITGQIAGRLDNTPMENARLYTLTNLVLADAAIVGWKSKYDNFFWRPITAIRLGGSDGNPFTTGDPSWIPLGFTQDGYDHRTPAFPSCESGHSIFAGAYFTVLKRFFGRDDYRFTLTSDELPGVVRTFDSFSEAADEMMVSRLYLGMHFMFDNTPAMTAGRKLGDFVFENALLPNP